ncbi:MAG: carbohydrate ABC transporter permease [Candidatus Ornithomonoglobus sp.]
MKQDTMQDRAINGLFYAILTIMTIACLIPFIIVVASSFTSEVSVLKNGYNMWPKEFSVEAYKLIFKTGTVWNAYKITIFVTAVGTLLSMLLTCMGAYAISVPTFRSRNIFAFFIYFTMLFSGGLVPSYLLISKYLGLNDSIWALILPALVNPWNLFLMRNFFRGIPAALSESAKIDGATDMRILFSIILPISLPAIATIGLFYALAYWNEWYRALLYIRSSDKFPLQYLIMTILRNINFASEMATQSGAKFEQPPQLTVQMATAVVTIGPIVFLYPFVQKYFVQGLTVGSVKG